MKSEKFCCELNVRYESMIDNLQEQVKDLKQKQKDAYLLELDLRGKVIDLEKALAEKRSAWAEQGLNLANAQNDLDSLLEVEAAARNLIVCGQYSTSAFEKLERLVK